MASKIITISLYCKTCSCFFKSVRVFYCACRYCCRLLCSSD